MAIFICKIFLFNLLELFCNIYGIRPGRDVSRSLDCPVQSDLFHSVRLCKWIEIMAFTGQSKICIGIFSLDILYLVGKSLLLVSSIQVNFGDILQETSQSSAFWDMGVDSYLKWLLLFSPNVLMNLNFKRASWDGTSLPVRGRIKTL